MPRVWLDDEFHSHPKVIAAGLDGAGLYARALSYCGAYLTDGFVPGEWVEVITNRRKGIVKTLTEVGLWKPVKGGFQIPDYLEHNDSKAEVLKYRAERSRSGKKGARRRWGGGKAAPPLFDDDGESHGNSYSDSHGSSDSSSHSESHDLANGKTHGSSMARDRAANTTTRTNTPAAEEEIEETAAAVPAEAPREGRVREVVESLPGTEGDESSSFKQILPLAMQLDSDGFEEVVQRVGERRNVQNPRGLLRWMLANEAGQRIREALVVVGRPNEPYVVPDPPPDLEGFAHDFALRWSDADFERAFEVWELSVDDRIGIEEVVADVRREAKGSP